MASQASVAERPIALPPAGKGERYTGHPSRDFYFDPEQLHAMLTAFDTVCTNLKLVRGKGDQRTELVALKIIDLAKDGERSADELASCALAEFTPH